MAKIEEKVKEEQKRAIPKEQNFTIRGKDDWQSVADFLVRVSGGRGLIAISGDLGAGKTTLVQFLAKQLGITETLNSPTFNILKTYSFGRGQSQNRGTLYHLDLYRLKTAKEILALGFGEWLLDPTGLLAVEWPEILNAHLPATYWSVKIEPGADGRLVTVRSVLNNQE